MPQRAIISSRNHLKIALRGDSSPSKPAFRRCLNLRHWFHEGEQAGHADVYAISMSSLQRLSRWQSEQLLFQVRSAFTCPKWPGPALLAVPLGRRVCLGTS